MSSDPPSPAPEPVTIHTDPTRCPACRGRSVVYKTRANRRNRKCPDCGTRYVTLEVHMTELERLLGKSPREP